MTAYVALLRAVNVGGRKLLMSDLKAIADDLGLAKAQTYIASGNLLFGSSKSEKQLKAALEERIARHMKAPIGVMIRTAEELRQIVAANPSAEEAGNRVTAIFLDGEPPNDAAAEAKNIADERIALGKREIYVAYGAAGIGRSKLKLPAAEKGTARNMNTVQKLSEMAGALE